MSYKRKSPSSSMTSNDADSVMFFKVYLPDRSSQQLELPSAFVKQLNGNLPSRSLVSSGNRTWSVDVKKIDNSLYLENGWRDFVSDSSLEPGDFLVFSYLGTTRFNVKIYGKSGCEKNSLKEIKIEKEDDQATPHHQYKQTNGHGESTNDLSGEEELSSGEGTNNFSNEGELSSGEGMRNLSDKEESSSGDGTNNFSNEEELSSGEGTDNLSDDEEELSSQEGTYNLSDEEELSSGDSKTSLESEKQICRKKKEIWVRKRTRASTKQKDNNPNAAAKKARAPVACGKSRSEYPHFKIGVLPVYIYHGSLNIPMPFAQKYLKVGKVETALQVLSRSWPVTLTTYRNGCCKISSGWLAFVRDNCIEEGDICLFELIDTSTYTFRVSIFPCCS